MISTLSGGRRSSATLSYTKRSQSYNAAVQSLQKNKNQATGTELSWSKVSMHQTKARDVEVEAELLHTEAHVNPNFGANGVSNGTAAVRRVTVYREAGQLGIVLVGGSDDAIGTSLAGAFVQSIPRTSLVGAGLQVGDKIIEVNGADTSVLGYGEVCDMLQAVANPVLLVVRQQGYALQSLLISEAMAGSNAPGSPASLGLSKPLLERGPNRSPQQSRGVSQDSASSPSRRVPPSMKESAASDSSPVRAPAPSTTATNKGHASKPVSKVAARRNARDIASAKAASLRRNVKETALLWRPLSGNVPQASPLRRLWRPTFVRRSGMGKDEDSGVHDMQTPALLDAKTYETVGSVQGSLPRLGSEEWNPRGFSLVKVEEKEAWMPKDFQCQPETDEVMLPMSARQTSRSDATDRRELCWKSGKTVDCFTCFSSSAADNDIIIGKDVS